MQNKALSELKNLMEEYEINLSQLALGIKVQAIRISEILNNKRRITADSDLRLCKFFKLKEGYFLNLQTTYDLALTKEKIADKLKEIKPFIKIG
ncbi:MAG: HigA family addiction module antitoxin [Alphaproteobacteria bacterium]|nr:HigA family addiction module antitoxin [Alphaproteobacteria bacterium]